MENGHILSIWVELAAKVDQKCWTRPRYRGPEPHEGSIWLRGSERTDHEQGETEKGGNLVKFVFFE
jgi:hypothetical protein